MACEMFAFCAHCGSRLAHVKEEATSAPADRRLRGLDEYLLEMLDLLREQDQPVTARELSHLGCFRHSASALQEFCRRGLVEMLPSDAGSRERKYRALPDRGR